MCLLFGYISVFDIVFVDIHGRGHYARCGHQWITCSASAADQSFSFDTVSEIVSHCFRNHTKNCFAFSLSAPQGALVGLAF